MRTFTELFTLFSASCVYLYLEERKTAACFLHQAEEEGFRFRNGTVPSSRPWEELYALHADGTISTLCWAGRMAFHHPERVLSETWVRVSYSRYAAGEEDFLWHETEEALPAGDTDDLVQARLTRRSAEQR